VQYLFVHEFGHHFAGLADEYYTSDVAYESTAARPEPWEKNVTADARAAKWAELLTPGVALLMPWPRAEFETHQRDVQARRRGIRARKASEAEMPATGDPRWPRTSSARGGSAPEPRPTLVHRRASPTDPPGRSDRLVAGQEAIEPGDHVTAGFPGTPEVYTCCIPLLGSFGRSAMKESQERTRGVSAVAWGFVLGTLFLIASSAWAAETGALEADLLPGWQQQLAQIQAQIAQWYRCADAVLALTVAVALLGVAASAIQGFQKSWCKPATVVVGLLVSGITAVNTQYYQLDNKTYRELAVESERLTRDVKNNIAAYTRPTSSDSDRETSYEAIIKRLDDFLDIKKKAPITLASTLGGSVVHARSPVQSEGRLSVQGVGVCNSLAQAKENSLRDAIEKGVARLRSDQKVAAAATDLQALRAYVEKYGQPGSTDFGFDSGTKTYDAPG